MLQKSPCDLRFGVWGMSLSRVRTFEKMYGNTVRIEKVSIPGVWIDVVGDAPSD